MDVDIGEQDDEDRGVLKRAGITESMLEQDPCTLKRTTPSVFTNELVIELRKFHGTVSLRMVDQLKYLAPFELLPDISDCKDSSLRSRADTVWKEYQKLNRHTKKADRQEVLADFQNTPFSLPRSRTQSEPVPSTSATQSKLKQAQKDLKHFKRRCAQAEHENEELEQRKEWLTQEYFSVVGQMQENADCFKKIMEEKSADVSDLSAALSAANNRNAELTASLDSLTARLSKVGDVRNANKKVKRRDKCIQEKDETIRELQGVIRADTQELSELREANSAAEEREARATETVASLRVKVKSLQDSRRKTESKLKRAEENKLQLETDLQATVDVLNNKLQELKKENTELQEIQSLMDSNVVTTFHDGKYSDDIREVIMDLLTSGVSMKKVDKVITTVLGKLAGKTVDRLPSQGLKSRLIVEARILAQRQVAEAIIAGGEDTERGNCLHQDGTSKLFKKYQTFDVTLPSGKTLTMAMSEVPSGDAAGIRTAFSESCQELAEVLCESGDEDVRLKTAQMITSFTTTMSDRGPTNPLFNQHLEDLRNELLPTAKQNWHTLTDDVKEELMKMSNYLCKMHLLVNFATEANSTLKLFENAVSQGKNPLAFSQQGESGAARLVRTACSAFTDHGNEKSGTPHYFKTHLSHQFGEDDNFMVTYRGNRFNILFYNAAAVYHHHGHIVSFVSSWPDPNGLLKAVKADAHQKVYLAGVRALGIIDKTVTGPFFRLLGIEKSVLKLNIHLHQMQLCLERWAKDASSLLAGEAMFNEELVARHKDAMFASLFDPSEDEELDVLTQQALEVVCASMLILLERQAEEQLPGGKFWETTEAEEKKAAHVPTTNVVSERDFAILDNLLRAKPYGRSLSFEAYLMWLNNQTSTWLQALSAEEKARHMEYARTHAGQVQEKFQQKAKEIKEKRLQTLLAKQKEKEEKLQRARQRKVTLTDKLVQMGGLWKTPDEVDSKLSGLHREKDKLEALKCQVQFHKNVLRSQGTNEQFQMTVTRTGRQKHTFTSAEKTVHLKDIIQNNMMETTSIESDSEDEVDDYVTLKEPESRNLQEVQDKLRGKLEDQREKREIKKQKELLPQYMKDPSKLVGCNVKHKCKVKTAGGETQEKWFAGKVEELVDRNEDPMKTVYKIVYEDENEPDDEFDLLVDLRKGDLIIL